jgi:hypothetical protein
MKLIDRNEDLNDNPFCSTCGQSVTFRIRRKLSQLLFIEVRTGIDDAQYPPPRVTVPLTYISGNDRYQLISIIFHHANLHHFSSLIRKDSKWYTSQNPTTPNVLRNECRLAQCGNIAHDAREWDGIMGRLPAARISFVVYIREIA